MATGMKEELLRKMHKITIVNNLCMSILNIKGSDYPLKGMEWMDR